MIKRAITIGIIGGVLISLAGVYPVMSLLTPVWLDGWERPLTNDISHGIALMLSAVLFVPLILTFGGVAARYAKVRSPQQGAKTGALAGLVAGFIIYFTLIAPLNALAAIGVIKEEIGFLSESYLPSLAVLDRYVNTFNNVSLQVEVVIVIGVLLWGFQGLFVGWIRRNQPAPKRPSLFQLAKEGNSPKPYFDGNEQALQIGLIVGLVIGTIALIAGSGLSFYVVAQDWPELLDALQSSHLGSIFSDPSIGASALLTPVLAAGLMGYGLFVILFLKNPPTWFRARWSGITLAGNTISFAIFAIGLRFFYFNFGLAPFWILRTLQANPADPMRAETVEAFNFFVRGFQSPEGIVFMIMTVPWLFIGAAIITGIVVSTFQAIVFVPLLSVMHKRPVDHAFMAKRALQKEPNNLLPHVYGLFKQEAHAYDILSHFVLRVWRSHPDVYLFASAYHTLGTSKESQEYLETTRSLSATLTKKREWRWAIDFAGAYNTLTQVMEAKTLPQILAIEPPPEQHTTSLPPLVVQSQQRISRIVNELKKIERTDDLGTKLIFLENSLSAIHETQSFIKTEFTDLECWGEPLPEYNAIKNALRQWEETVLTAVKRLKGRADVLSTLKSNQCACLPELPVTITVRNQGLNVAQMVRVKLLPGENYDLLGLKSETAIEILPAGEEKETHLFIAPRPDAKRLRLAWELSYDDAVDAERQVSFADKVEFVQPDRPFMRIFPIPYVTGTPLKTDDVFVGREDVFSFIQEMLVGAHQNNMVILHGQRRTGKTSVLYRMREVVAETHYSVLIDMQGKPARGEAEFLYSIADDIVFALEDEGIEVDLPERADFEENPEFFFRSRFIRGIKEHLNGKQLLLLFDEFEELQRRVEDGRLQPEIFQFLRNMMQHESSVDFIFAGTHKLEELGAEYWSALFNIAAYRPITFLSRSDMRRLITEPIKAYNTEYDPLAIDRIINVTAGHPYFAQLLLHEMIVYHNEMRTSYLTAVDVDQVIQRIVDRGAGHFRYIWDESSEEEQIILQAMAELLISHDAVPAKTLLAFLDERGVSSSDNWKMAIRSLKGRDILMTNDAKNPLYRFKVDLIRAWIAQTRPSL